MPAAALTCETCDEKLTFDSDSPEVAATVVATFLDAHPEHTLTIQDNVPQRELAS